MKKLIAILLIFTVFAGLSGCKKNEEYTAAPILPNQHSESDIQNETKPEPEVEPEPEAEPEPENVNFKFESFSYTHGMEEYEPFFTVITSEKELEDFAKRNGNLEYRFTYAGFVLRGYTAEFFESHILAIDVKYTFYSNYTFEVTDVAKDGKITVLQKYPVIKYREKNNLEQLTITEIPRSEIEGTPYPEYKYEYEKTDDPDTVFAEVLKVNVPNYTNVNSKAVQWTESIGSLSEPYYIKSYDGLMEYIEGWENFLYQPLNNDTAESAYKDYFNGKNEQFFESKDIVVIFRVGPSSGGSYKWKSVSENGVISYDYIKSNYSSCDINLYMYIFSFDKLIGVENIEYNGRVVAASYD